MEKGFADRQSDEGDHLRATTLEKLAPQRVRDSSPYGLIPHTGFSYSYAIIQEKIYLDKDRINVNLGVSKGLKMDTEIMESVIARQEERSARMEMIHHLLLTCAQEMEELLKEKS